MGDPTDPNDPAWANAMADIPCLYLCTYNEEPNIQPDDPVYYALVGNLTDGQPFIELPDAVNMFYSAHSTGSLDDIELYQPTNQEFQDLQNSPLFTFWSQIGPDAA